MMILMKSGYLTSWAFIVGVLLIAISPATALEYVVATGDQLQNVLDIVQPGDVILIPNVEIRTEGIRTNRSGTPGNPITIRGLGYNSVLKRTGSSSYWVILVDHTLWVLDNFRVECEEEEEYRNGIYVSGFDTQVVVTNMFFGIEGPFRYGIYSEPFSGPAVEHCTFVVGEQGHGIMSISWPTDDPGLLSVKNSHFITAANESFEAIYFANKKSFILENNVFSVQNPGRKWWNNVIVEDSIGTIRNNTGSAVTGNGFQVKQNGGPGSYLFEGNHCDLPNGEAYCIYFEHRESYNNATMRNNTFENGKALTNY